MRLVRGVVLCLVIGALLGCGGKQQRVSPRGTTDSNLITRDQISDTNAQNAYQVIERLRPNWLRHPSGSLSNPAAGALLVYLDNARMGGVDFLYQISAMDVESLQHLNAAEASSRFGLNHTGGAILVITRR